MFLIFGATRAGEISSPESYQRLFAVEVQASKHDKVKADLASERRFINSVGVRKRARCGAPRHHDDKHVISNTKKRLKRKAVSVRAFAESLQGDDELASILAVVRAQP